MMLLVRRHRNFRNILHFFQGHERAPEGSALAATTGRSTLMCDKQAIEEARQKRQKTITHFFFPNPSRQPIHLCLPVFHGKTGSPFTSKPLTSPLFLGFMTLHLFAPFTKDEDVLWWPNRCRGHRGAIAGFGFAPEICEELYYKYGSTALSISREEFS
eukprot:GGOE01003679.1.p1 GENE.GGOE01003679.1~~GGOE01003679.1.p1  ORF type:complete len:158 (+),score=5.45 GGOE01003679.1:115-588(+)